MAFEGSNLQGLNLQAILDLQQPKAHDAIDNEINQSKIMPIPERDWANPLGIDEDINEFAMNFATGGAGGGTIKTGTKVSKNILSKILARNAKAHRDLRPGAPIRGQQTLKPEDSKYLSEGWRKWEDLTKEISGSKNPEMKKYLGRLREELSPHYSGPTGSWHQGRFNLDYDPPSGRETAALLGPIFGGILGMTMYNDPRFKGYGKLEGEHPNIGLPPKQY